MPVESRNQEMIKEVTKSIAGRPERDPTLDMTDEQFSQQTDIDNSPNDIWDKYIEENSISKILENPEFSEKELTDVFPGLADLVGVTIDAGGVVPAVTQETIQDYLEGRIDENGNVLVETRQGTTKVGMKVFYTLVLGLIVAKLAVSCGKLPPEVGAQDNADMPPTDIPTESVPTEYPPIVADNVEDPSDERPLPTNTSSIPTEEVEEIVEPTLTPTEEIVEEQIFADFLEDLGEPTGDIQEVNVIFELNGESSFGYFNVSSEGFIIKDQGFVSSKGGEGEMNITRIIPFGEYSIGYAEMVNEDGSRTIFLVKLDDSSVLGDYQEGDMTTVNLNIDNDLEGEMSMSDEELQMVRKVYEDPSDPAIFFEGKRESHVLFKIQKFQEEFNNWDKEQYPSFWDYYRETETFANSDRQEEIEKLLNSIKEMDDITFIKLMYLSFPQLPIPNLMPLSTEYPTDLVTNSIDWNRMSEPRGTIWPEDTGQSNVIIKFYGRPKVGSVTEGMVLVNLDEDSVLNAETGVSRGGDMSVVISTLYTGERNENDVMLKEYLILKLDSNGEIVLVRFGDENFEEQYPERTMFFTKYSFGDD